MTDREKLIELLVECSCIDGAGAELIEKKADHLLANGVTLQRWIPVTERLPDEYEECLCVSRDWNGDPLYEVDTFGGESYPWSNFSGKGQHEITHWMPLPEAPKEDKKEDKKNG